MFHKLVFDMRQQTWMFQSSHSKLWAEAAGSWQPLKTMGWVRQPVPDSHSKLWAEATGSWQPLKTMGWGSRFLTATQNYGLRQPVPDSHSKLWAEATRSWQPLKTMGWGNRFLTATQNYGLRQPVPDSHSKLWAEAAGSWQPLKTMGWGNRFLTATQNYGLRQPVPDSHSKLWAEATGSWQPLKTMGWGNRFHSDIVRGKTIMVLCWILQGGIVKDNECMFWDDRQMTTYLVDIFCCKSSFKTHDSWPDLYVFFVKSMICQVYRYQRLYYRRYMFTPAVWNVYLWSKW